ncbi:MAG: hypothetical protein U5L74_06635 [Ideonella sp.]|nr:hypothetical protein [Ideonella sp.]
MTTWWAWTSLEHYGDCRRAWCPATAQRTERGLLFTFAPANPLLVSMRAIGRLFPKSDRAPWIVPVAPREAAAPDCRRTAAGGLQPPAQTQRVASGSYTSQAMALHRGEEPIANVHRPGSLQAAQRGFASLARPTPDSGLRRTEGLQI